MRLLLIVVCGLAAVVTHALPTNLFAKQSKLSSGRWVRITVTADGVYELTQAELAAMGFSNIDRVAIYGTGGHLLSEVLDGSAPDDLQPLPALKVGDKLCFYGKGPLNMTLTDVDGTPHFERQLNVYATSGSYFLTEQDNPQRITTRKWIEPSSPTTRSNSYDYFFHELDSLSYTNTGKEILGEDIFHSTLRLDYALPDIVSNELAVLLRMAVGGSSVGVKMKVSSQLNAGANTYPLTTLQATMRNNYEVGQSLTEVDLSAPIATGQLQVNPARVSSTSSSGAVERANLDYAIITYIHGHNLADKAQIRMHLSNVKPSDVVTVTGSEGTHVWNVEKTPVEYQVKQSGSQVQFTPAVNSPTALFVAFDPSKTLNKISGYEAVDNQDIHGKKTPQMIILSDPELLSQAHRVASLHQINDKMDVLVLTPQQVYNEFSSGTPDAMAVRLMCKMFYDRSPERFKYLLLFGQAFFDQRNILSRKPCTVITYESDNSNKNSESFGCDDFFGFLDDGSGVSLASDVLRLGVGRITSNSLEEAIKDVDKLSQYIENPDYGPWRANVFLSADQGDSDVHMWQAESLGEFITGDNQLAMAIEKDFVPMYAKSLTEFGKEWEERSSPEANRRMKEALDMGQYFGVYVGHASQAVFTAKSHLWTINNAKTVKYSHWPIFATVCCDATHYDSGKRGIAEHMFHNDNGGAIAVLASTRGVYSISNYELIVGFINGMFCAGVDGEMPTLGEAYMKCKQAFAGRGDFNKMMYILLGDPAMKLNYPRPLMKVTKVNATNVTNGKAVEVRPLQQLTVEAHVYDANGAVDESFTGEATLTLYSSQRLLREGTRTYSDAAVTRSIFYPRSILARVQGRVERGRFVSSVVVPRDVVIDQGNMALYVYAHKAGTDRMVSGAYNNLTPVSYNASMAVEDDTPPAITAMYLDDVHSFSYNNVVNATPTLHISVTDDIALSNQSGGISGAMKLLLDHGKETYYFVKNHATLTDNGRAMTIDYPMEGIPFGEHTLTFQVFDVAGNMAEKTITFVMGQTTNLELSVAEQAVKNQAVFGVFSTTLPGIPEVQVVVTDALGRQVWSHKTSSFPCTWDLKDAHGSRVPSGVYYYHGLYDTMDHYGGTPKQALIVLDP